VVGGDWRTGSGLPTAVQTLVGVSSTPCLTVV
jgi:hypothetical protein